MPPEDAVGDMGPGERRLVEASWYLAKHIGVEPQVLILVCQEAAPSHAAGGGGGLGGCLTTAHLVYEDEIKTILGIPEQASTFALIPLGYPQDRFGGVRRNPVDVVSYADRWGVPLHV